MLSQVLQLIWFLLEMSKLMLAILVVIQVVGLSYELLVGWAQLIPICGDEELIAKQIIKGRIPAADLQMESVGAIQRPRTCI